jgi:branched-chain amino acid transport system substrate-binding protein
MENKTIVWLVVAIVVVGGLIWWGSSKKAGPVGDTYKVGVILSLTGDAASYGEGARNVYQIALDEINAAGGINGKPMELVIEDGKCNGQDAASAAQKLINVDKVQVILGGFCSGESLAVVPVATQAKVSEISPSASSPKLTGISQYFVRDYPSDSAQGSVLADVAYNDKGWRKIAFIQEQTDYAQGVFDAFKAEFEHLGGTIIDNQQFPTETTDFRSIVAKVKSENPEALFVDTQTAASADRVLKQISQADWSPKILVSDVTIGDPATLTGNKTLLEGALGAEFGVDASNPKYAALVASYKEKYNADLPYQSYGQAEYDAMYLIRDAIESAGYDGSAIAQWFRGVKDWQGASGSITIKSDGDRASAHSPEMVVDGKMVPYTK